MKSTYYRRSLLIYSFLVLFITAGFAQGVSVDFNTIPKSGTVLMYAHQDDDVIWMLPFWNKTEKFISGEIPSTPIFRNIVHEQQLYLDSHGYNINYESNWLTPWRDITNTEYTSYYWNNQPEYSYISLDHVEARLWNATEELSRTDINKIKAKIEQYVSNPDVSRIITHDNWGEYGHKHHKALNKAVRELATKYKKDVWMLGTNGSFVDWQIPTGANITYTLANYDVTLFTSIRAIYQAYEYWTWDATFTPGNNIKYIKIVDNGIDKSDILTGEQVTVTGPVQNVPGAYIFDGIDDYMTLSGNNNTSFTIAMRVRPDQIGAMDISKMAEYPSSPTCDRSFYLDAAGHVTARINDGQSRTVTSVTALSAASWSHLVMTNDGSNLKIYVNGVLEGTVPAGLPVSYTSPEFVLGQAQETASFFKGQISDVKLFDHALSQSEIAALSTTLTISGVTANSKGYDGTTVATLNTGSATLMGVVSNDIVNLVKTAAAGSFSDKNVGTGKSVSISGFTLSGADAGKYTLVQPVTTASISAKELIIGGTFISGNKVYNSTTAATITTNNLTLPGKVGSDAVTLTPLATFASPTVGNGKIVSLTGSSLSGADVSNYTLSLTGAPTATANISAKVLYIGGSFSANDKVYDGTAVADISTNNLTLITKAGIDDVTIVPVAAFANQNAGKGKTVSLTGSSLAGTDKSNYTLSFSGAPATAGNIFAKQITINPVASQYKTEGDPDPLFLFTNSEWSNNTHFTGTLGRVPGESVGSYAYTMGNLSAGSNYSLIIVASPSTFTISAPTGIEDIKTISGLALRNYPNPFMASTRISYTLPFGGQVNLTIQNIAGQVVKTIINNTELKGDYDLNIEVMDLQAGVYFLTLRLNDNGKELRKTIRLLKGGY